MDENVASLENACKQLDDIVNNEIENGIPTERILIGLYFKRKQLIKT